MPTNPLDRLMFAQGGLCFFCNLALSKAEASVEHLVGSARGGSNGDDNCVACCKAVNALLGSMSLKEKIKVVLNQKGQFKCPNGARSASPKSKPPPQPPSKEITAHRLAPETISAVIANLIVRGNARPRRLRTLASSIKALIHLKLDDNQVSMIIDHLQVPGKIVITNDQIEYKL